MKEHYFAGILLSPTLLIIGIIVGYISIYSFVLSLQRVNLTGKTGVEYTFIGLKNYFEALANPIVIRSIKNTLLFTCISLGATFCFALVVALVVNGLTRFRGAFVALFMIPWGISPVASGLIWKWIFDPSFGVANSILWRLGIIENYRMWFGDMNIAMYLVIVVAIWRNFPFLFIVLFAALRTVPDNLYEAAVLDGATASQRFLYITLPYIRYTALTGCVIQTVWYLRIFDLFYILTEGGPAYATMVLNLWAFKQSFFFYNIGFGSAMAVILTVITLLISLGYFAIIAKTES